MNDLLVLSEFPEVFKTKTGIGADTSYKESAKLAQHLLEDIVKAASQVCNVTVVTSHEDAKKFNQDKKYSQWNVYGSEKGLIHQLSDSIKNRHLNEARNVIAISGDVVVRKDEIESWFKDLDKYSSLIGQTIGPGDFRYLDFQLNHPFYMIGFDKKFGTYLAKNLPSNPNFASFAYACLKGVLEFHKLKITQRKRHINTIHDLNDSLLLMPSGETKNFAEGLVRAYKSAYKR